MKISNQNNSRFQADSIKVNGRTICSSSTKKTCSTKKK